MKGTEYLACPFDIGMTRDSVGHLLSYLDATVEVWVGARRKYGPRASTHEEAILPITHKLTHGTEKQASVRRVQPLFFAHRPPPSRAPGSRQRHAEGCPLPDLAVHANLTAHRLNQVLHDGQTQTGAAGFASASLVHAIEPLENAVHVRFWNAHAGIFHFKAHGVVGGTPTHGDAPAVGRVLDRVIDEVIHHLPQRVRIGPRRHFARHIRR